jgi:hypothetical protein
MKKIKSPKIWLNPQLLSIHCDLTIPNCLFQFLPLNVLHKSQVCLNKMLYFPIFVSFLNDDSFTQKNCPTYTIKSVSPWHRRGLVVSSLPAPRRSNPGCCHYFSLCSADYFYYWRCGYRTRNRFSKSNV